MNSQPVYWSLSRRSHANNTLLPTRISRAPSDSDADRPPEQRKRKKRTFLPPAWRNSPRTHLVLACLFLLLFLAAAAALLRLRSIAARSVSDERAHTTNPSSATFSLPRAASSLHLATELSLLLCPAAPDSHVLPPAFEWLPSPQQPQLCGSTDFHGTASYCDDAPSASLHLTLRRGTGYGLDARNGESAAEWMVGYEYHNVTQRDARLPPRYVPTTAPWYEVQLADSGMGAGWRLLVHEAQWRLSADPAAGVVEGVDIVVAVVPIAAYWDSEPRTLNGTTIPFLWENRTLTEALLDRMHCSFTADAQRNGEESEQSSGGKAADVSRAAATINNAAPLPITSTGNRFLSEGMTHHIIHCPLPYLPPSSHELLIHRSSAGQSKSSPLLALTSFSLQLHKSRSSAFDLSILTLPLCLLRHRRVTTALVLSTQLGPPHLLHPQRLHAFLAYYMFLGVQLFIVPERFGPLLTALQPYVDMGAVWYVRQPFPSATRHQYLDQMPVLHACVMRLQYAAEWVLHMDVDEYLAFDHPYWSEGAGVQPSSDDCWLSAEQSGRATGCRSMLSSFLAQPGFEKLSLLHLASVLHWGLAPSVNDTLLALPSSPATATAYVRSFHPLDVWTRRCFGAEKYRYKLLFRPSHLLTVTMHEASLRFGHTVEPEGGGVVDAWEKYWGDSGLQAHKETILGNAITERAAVSYEALLQQAEDRAEVTVDEFGVKHMRVEEPVLTVQHEHISWHHNLTLASLLCGDDMRWRADVRSSFDTSCCNSAPANNSCFVAGAVAFSPYLLATLTPLFPTVAQSDYMAPHYPILPRPIPDWVRPMPLAAFGLHVTHLMCSHMAAVDLPHCRPANRTHQMAPMWGESQRAGVSFDAEEGEERAGLALRAAFQQWAAERPWAERWRGERPVIEQVLSIGSGDL